MRAERVRFIMGSALRFGYPARCGQVGLAEAPNLRPRLALRCIVVVWARVRARAGRVLGAAGWMRQMDLPLVDSTEAPLPPELVRFREVKAAAYADGARVRLTIRLTPFQVRPDLEIVVVDDQGTEVASSSVVENAETELGLTLHLRRRNPVGSYTVRLSLGYPEKEPVDRAEIVFTAPALESGT